MTRPIRIMVAGGGPGGMKAAAVAGEIGHEVTLFEASKRLGGQVLLAQNLPHRAEFGGLVTNLAREVELSGAKVRLGTPVTRDLIASERPDVIIVATGSEPRFPPFERGEGIQVVLAEEVIAGLVKVGRRVVVYDWLADWTGVGVAEKLAQEGAHVRLAVNGVCAAASIQNYVRDAAIARLHKQRIETIPFMRLYGAEDSTVYMLHTASQEAVVLEGVDTLVLSTPNRPRDELASIAKSLDIPFCLVGDALTPRTAEEAVFEGLQAVSVLTITGVARV